MTLHQTRQPCSRSHRARRRGERGGLPAPQLYGGGHGQTSAEEPAVAPFGGPLKAMAVLRYTAKGVAVAMTRRGSPSAHAAETRGELPCSSAAELGGKSSCNGSTEAGPWRAPLRT